MLRQGLAVVGNAKLANCVGNVHVQRAAGHGRYETAKRIRNNMWRFVDGPLYIHMYIVIFVYTKRNTIWMNSLRRQVFL